MALELNRPRKEIELPIRLRRKRQTIAIRALLEETRLNSTDLVAPLFVVEGTRQKQPISSMPEVYRYSIDLLIEEVLELEALGLTAVNLFAYVPEEKKDPFGSESMRPGNLLSNAISTLKQKIPGICLMVDIALDPYTDHGHDGFLNSHGEVENDFSLELLGKMSLLAADAGADLISPSDMMDGRVGYLRGLLDRSGYSKVGIVSYAAKYASAFYGPFRQALDSAPKSGDKKSYQLNPANIREALLECSLDEAEGADMLLIKPALPYLDVVAKIRERTLLPIGAYHVSGEYAMLMAAAKEGWLNRDAALAESLLSIKRAGADFIFTYGAKRMAEILKQNGK
ncbi:MAG: porphobilinogen synthase [Parachlamydiaceae bacterium]|nr:porphobilinogen synthase [Parachlamydiaceae bacterium]